MLALALVSLTSSIEQWRLLDATDPGLQKVRCVARKNAETRRCATLEWDELNSEVLAKASEPILIKNYPWNLYVEKEWSFENLKAHRGHEFFALTPTRNVTVDEKLRTGGYHLVHVEKDRCYHPIFGQYSPFVSDSINDLAEMPAIFGFPLIIQVAMGVTDAFTTRLGVPPEAHSPAWLMQVHGQKHWLLHSPGIQKPCTSFKSNSCDIEHLPEMRCVQNPGDILWTPEGWWHETCTSTYSVAYGAVTIFEKLNMTSKRCEGDYYQIVY